MIPEVHRRLVVGSIIGTPQPGRAQEPHRD
jgi:hypothetical protein